MVRIFATALLLYTLCVVDLAQGQEPLPTGARSSAYMTPEMWFYQQQIARHDDPRMAVRRKAEFRAQQRQQRIAARKWYGFSNSRPTANATPWSSMYSPAWTASAGRPFGWNPSAVPTTIVVPRDGARETDN